MRPLTSLKDLSTIDGTILAKLKHLDLTGRVESMSLEATGQGTFSEVFEGLACVPGRGALEVAIKRIRFHLKSTDCKRVSN